MSTALDEATEVSLVIPARNAERTIDACLAAAARLLGTDHLAEIVLVDDGSTDRTRAIGSQYPIRVLDGGGHGAAAARNVGWQAARSPWIWFLDADCVPRPDALRLLRPHLAGRPEVAAAGGSYENLCPDSPIASLVHEEIVARHRWMPVEVTVLASYHVLYRRAVLVELGGFDAACRWAHDAELAYRVRKAGYRLRFERESRVGHVHPTRLLSYLDKQRQQGYWRVMLYRRHPQRISGDSYSGWVDFLQPPLAMLSVAAAPGTPFAAAAAWISLGCLLLLAALQIPMTVRIVRATRRARGLLFLPFGWIRAFWRGAGMVHGLWDSVFRREPPCR